MDIAQLQIQFKKLLSAKNLDGLEALWLEIISQPGAVKLADLNLLFELLQSLYNIFPEKGLLFLSILTEHIKETGDDFKLLALLKETAGFYEKSGLNDKKSKVLRKEIGDCFRRLYPTRSNLEGFIRKTELLENQPILTACQQLEQYLLFDTDANVYSPDFGLGKVLNVDLLLDRVSIQFSDDKILVLPVNQIFKSAGGEFIPLAEDDFLLVKHRAPEIVKKQIKNNPLGLLKSMLKSNPKPMKPSEIKQLLTGIATEDVQNQFWEKVKKLASSDPHIIIAGSPPTYGYSQTAIQKPSSEKKSPLPDGKNDFNELRNKILRASKDEIPTLINENKNFTMVKKILLSIKENRPDDWVEIYWKTFSSNPDNRVLSIIAAELNNFDAVLFSTRLKDIFHSYRSCSNQFLWLATSDFAREISAKSFLTRFLDILASAELRTYWNDCKKLLVAQNYRFVKSAISSMSEAEIESFWNRINALPYLESGSAGHKVEIKKIIKELCPGLALDTVTEVSKFIYSTKEGIEKKKQELHEIMTVAIPKSAQEIARAREFGDLSENYEYKAAKEKQARLFAKANIIRAELKNSKPINFDTVSTSVINIGTKVTLQDLSSNEIHEYTILGPYDIDPDQKVISYLAPFAQLLLGKKVGDTVISEPNNEPGKTNKIVAITKAR